MLTALGIRDIVLIESLDLDFCSGLNVLTGETGAGKSILLDALGFALGRSGRRSLVRPGAKQGSVQAVFDVPTNHPARAALEDLGLPTDSPELILRRVAAADGPSRAFIDDQRVSADVMARIGELLVEVHGQHDDRGLLNPRAHRPLLDAFGELEWQVAKLRRHWTAWQEADVALTTAREEIETAAADADFLRHAVEELARLAPEPGEDALLDAERRLIQQAARLTEEILRAAAALSQQADPALGQALSWLTHVAERAEGRLEEPIAAIDRTMAELAEAQGGLTRVLDELSFDPGRLEVVEERLFAIRGLARKHQVQPEDLPGLTEELAGRLATIDAGADRIDALEAEMADRRATYDQAAEALTKARAEAARRLDAAVTEELAPLKMEAARFMTDLSPAPPGPDGADQVRFTAAINPGAPAGPIDRIASGGELSRFLLALKVRLAARAEGLTMIFDEIDRGVGGATADAVGRRLARLAASGQVLVVTHSPQVAALGAHHWRIAKSTAGEVTRTDVRLLDPEQRRDEIARMLAGETITAEARSAAAALIDAAG